MNHKRKVKNRKRKNFKEIKIPKKWKYVFSSQNNHRLISWGSVNQKVWRKEI